MFYAWKAREIPGLVWDMFSEQSWPLRVVICSLALALLTLWYPWWAVGHALANERR